MKSVVLVFAKTPISGTVKTRLASVIGNKKALWIYKKLLSKTDSELKKISQEVVVFYHGEPSSLFKKIFSYLIQNSVRPPPVTPYTWGANCGHSIPSFYPIEK